MANPELPFPMVGRKVFANNPLVEVVCEFRFPTILRIDSDVPADFQDKVRRRFPKFSRQSPPVLPDLPAEVADALSGAIPKPALSFDDADDVSGITLTAGRMAITCQNYQSWDNFKEDIDLSLHALIDVYDPTYFERIGIRYVNLIEREKLGLKSESWAELLNPMVAAELAADGWAQNIIGVRKSVQVTIPNTEDMVHFQHGLGTVGESELSYVLDFDYSFSQMTEAKDVDGIIERLHGYSGSAFQWAISDKLKVALG